MATQRQPIAEAFADYKRMLSYFNGERIKPHYVERYVTALVNRCLPASLRWKPDGGDDGTVAALARAVVQAESIHWDHMTFRLNMLQHDDESAGDATYSALRLFALDVGIRLGAYLALREFQTRKAPNWDAAQIDDDALERWIVGRCKSRGVKFADLRREFSPKLSVTALRSWRSGSALPSPANLVDLAARLTLPHEDVAIVTLQLRLLVGVLDIRRQLKKLIEVPGAVLRVDELFAGTLCAARHAHQFFKPPAPSKQLASLDIAMAAKQIRLENSIPEWLPPMLTQTAFQGAACDAGANCASALATIAAAREQVAHDFKALASDWQIRVGFWRQHVARTRMAIRLITESSKFSDTFPREIAVAHCRQELERDCRMRDFDQPLEKRVIEAEPADPTDPKRMAHELLRQSREAYSVGDHGRLFELLCEAERLDPDDASTHFKLGYELLRQGFKTGDDKLVDAAICEMQIALELKPTDQNFCTEYGATLCALKRFGDAEVWFARAEVHCKAHPSFLMARGKNYLALDRFSDAESVFRHAMHIDPANIDAKGMLVVALMAQGKTTEAGTMAKDVLHVMHADPANDWRDVIEFCKGRRRST